MKQFILSQHKEAWINICHLKKDTYIYIYNVTELPASGHHFLVVNINYEIIIYVLNFSNEQ